MDIKNEIEKTVTKITGDESLIEKFKKDPLATVKGLIGDGAPKELIDGIITAVKAKLEGSKLEGVVDKITGIFKK